MAFSFGEKIKERLSGTLQKEPAEIAMHAQDYAGLLPDLTLLARTAINSLQTGPYNQRRVGAGDSFWQYRPYEVGDSPRQIDWKATARFGETLILQKEAENMQKVQIHLPFTEELTYRPDYNWLNEGLSEALHLGKDFVTGQHKSTLKRKVEAQPAFIADKYAACIFVATCLMLALKQSRHPFTVSARPDMGYRFTDDHMLEALDSLCSQDNEASQYQGGKNHLFWIGDFWDAPEVIEKQIIDVRNQGGVPYLLQIISRDEIDLSAKGHVLYQDMHQSDDFDVPLAEQIRASYKDKIIAHLQELDKIARRQDVYIGRYIMSPTPLKDANIIGHNHILEFLEDMMGAIAIPKSGIMA